MSVFTHFSYHSRRGLVEIPDECWSYFHHPDELGAHSGTLHLLPGREHAPHYYYAKDLLPEVDLGWGAHFCVLTYFCILPTFGVRKEHDGPPFKNPGSLPDCGTCI